MNRRMVLKTLGNILIFEALILVLPLLVSIVYREHMEIYFLLTIAISYGVGHLLSNIKTQNNKRDWKGCILFPVSFLYISDILKI